jgi:hypothetical protein
LVPPVAVVVHRERERRTAILVVGGDKTGNDRWYEENVPPADVLYDECLRALEQEGLI